MGLSQAPPPPPPVSVADAPVSPLALSSSPPHPAAIAASAKTRVRNMATRLHRAPLPFDPYTSLFTFILPRRAGRSGRRNSARLGVSASKNKFAERTTAPLNHLQDSSWWGALARDRAPIRGRTG